MPGRASDTYLRPADSAASLGSTMVGTSAADSNKASPFLPQNQQLDTRIRVPTESCRGNSLPELKVQDPHQESEAHRVSDNDDDVTLQDSVDDPQPDPGG